MLVKRSDSKFAADDASEDSAFLSTSCSQDSSMPQRSTMRVDMTVLSDAEWEIIRDLASCTKQTSLALSQIRLTIGSL